MSRDIAVLALAGGAAYLAFKPTVKPTAVGGYVPPPPSSTGFRPGQQGVAATTPSAPTAGGAGQPGTVNQTGVMSDVSDALKVGVTIATGVENAFTKGSPNGAATVQPSLDYTQGGNYNSLGSAIDTYNPTLNYDSSSSQAALSQAVTGSAPPAFGSTDFQLQPPSLDSGADAFNPGP